MKILFSRSLRSAAALGLVSFLTSCGANGFNFNEMFVSKAQQESIDELMQEAQYEYDKGRYDNALGLTNQALDISPNATSPSILKSYVYLSKAGLDAINLSKKLIDANDSSAGKTVTTTTPKTGDTTTDNFNILKTILNLTDTDYNAMGIKDAIGGEAIYFPKSATLAREGGSTTLDYINEAVKTLCPLVPSTSNPEGDLDTRHACTKNPYIEGPRGRSNFAWALAHLGEAISFYSVVLYDSDGNGIPNLQAAIPTGNITLANAETFIRTLNSLNNALNAIFPTDPTAAADSMLNALFADLKTTSTALASIPGIPDEVGDSVQKSITDLQAKIDQITATTTQASAASAQNEALKNSLTKGVATQLESKIESTEFQTLSPENKTQACCVYRNMNATAAAPTTCDVTNYNDSTCARVFTP
ncbi:MAG: hypothetical protein V4655_02395 [Bdellovibrionota bacterium]